MRAAIPLRAARARKPLSRLPLHRGCGPRRRRSPSRLYGDGIVPFLIAGALFGLLIALAGPAHSAELGQRQQLAAVPDETVEAAPAAGLDLTIPAQPQAGAADPGKTFDRPATPTVELAPDVALTGVYRLDLSLYPDDLRPKAGRGLSR